MRFAGDALTGDYINAGGSGANIFDTVSKKTPNYGELGNISMAEQSKEKQQSMFSSAKVAGAGIQSLGAATQAANTAAATAAQAEAEASAAQFGGMADMFGGLGGAAISKFGGGGGSTTGFGSLGPSNFDLNANFGGF